MTLTIIGILLLSMVGSSESFFGSIISLVLVIAVSLALATEFGIISVH